MFEGQLSQFPTRYWWPIVWNCVNQIAGFYVVINQEMVKSLDEFPVGTKPPEHHLEYLFDKVDELDKWIIQIQGLLGEIANIPTPKKNVEVGFLKWLKLAVSAQFCWVNIARNSFVIFAQARVGTRDFDATMKDIQRVNADGFELTQVLPRTLDSIQKDSKWPHRTLMDEKTEYNRIIRCEARLQKLQTIL